jgi:hypothetical protein
MSYYTLKESFTDGSFKDRVPIDHYPFYDAYKNNPISDDSIIRANIAGYQPYKRSMQQITPVKQVEVKAIYPSVLLLPQDYPITYPCSTIRSKASGLVKPNIINVPP